MGQKAREASSATVTPVAITHCDGASRKGVKAPPGPGEGCPDGSGATRTAEDSPLWGADGSRELFPLEPWGVRQLAPGRAPSRALRRRFARREFVDRLAFDAVTGLNALAEARAGHPLRCPQEQPHLRRCLDVHRDANRHIRACCSHAADDFGDASKHGALSELCKTPSLYDTVSTCPCVPMALDRLKILRGDTRPKDIHQLIGPDAKHFVNKPYSYIPRTAHEQELYDHDHLPPVPYSDPKLRDKRFLRRLVDGLSRVGLITYRRRVLSFIGFFAVSKKDGSQRLIGAARAASHLHRRPPYAALSAPSALSGIRLSHEARDAQPEGAGIDFQDGFYQFEWEEMAGFFGIDCVCSAREAGVERVYDDGRQCWTDADPDELLWPCFKGLVMGWSWSLFLCNSTLTHGMTCALQAFNPALSRAEAAEQVVRDRAPAPKLSAERPLLCPYVDNGNSLCWNGDVSARFLTFLLAELEGKGLILKDIVDHGRLFDMVGVVWDAAACRWWPKAKRLWTLRWALLEAAGRPRLSGVVAQILAGHMVNFSLLNRTALAVPQEIFEFIQVAGSSWIPVTPALRSELRVFAAILPLVFHDPCRRMSPLAFCSDASGAGYALHVSTLGGEVVADIARWRERWRFRDEDEPTYVAPDPSPDFVGRSAEDHDICPVFADWVASQGGRRGPRSRAPLPRSMPPRLREVPAAVPPLPDDILDVARWRRVAVGAWRDPAAIHLKEARIALLGLRIACRTPAMADAELLSLGDNMGEVLSHDRGRARDRGLNAVCRRSAAHRLALNLCWNRRYVETGRNPSDADSRLAERGVLRPGEKLKPGHRPSGVSLWRSPSAKLPMLVGFGPDSAQLTGLARQRGLRVGPVFDPHAARDAMSFDPVWLRRCVAWLRRGLVWCAVVFLPAPGYCARSGPLWFGSVLELLRQCRRFRVPVVVSKPLISDAHHQARLHHELRSSKCLIALSSRIGSPENSSPGTPYQTLIYSNFMPLHNVVLPKPALLKSCSQRDRRLPSGGLRHVGHSLEAVAAPHVRCRGSSPDLAEAWFGRVRGKQVGPTAQAEGHRFGTLFAFGHFRGSNAHLCDTTASKGDPAKPSAPSSRRLRRGRIPSEEDSVGRDPSGVRQVREGIRGVDGHLGLVSGRGASGRPPGPVYCEALQVGGEHRGRSLRAVRRSLGSLLPDAVPGRPPAGQGEPQRVREAGTGRHERPHSLGGGLPRSSEPGRNWRVEEPLVRRGRPCVLRLL